MAVTDHEAYVALQDRCDELETKLAAVTAERDEAQAVIDGVRGAVGDIARAAGQLTGANRVIAQANLARLNKVDGL